MRSVERPEKPKAPPHLYAATRRWWAEVVEDYDLQAHHVRLLTIAAQTWDRLEEARERLRMDGSYVPDRYGALKAHPAIAVERDARIAFARLVRELDLDGEPAPDPRMPRRRG